MTYDDRQEQMAAFERALMRYTSLLHLLLSKTAPASAKVAARRHIEDARSEVHAELISRPFPERQLELDLVDA